MKKLMLPVLVVLLVIAAMFGGVSSSQSSTKSCTAVSTSAGLTTAIANAATNEVICLTGGLVYSAGYNTIFNSGGNSGVVITTVPGPGGTKATIQGPSGTVPFQVDASTDGWTLGPNLIFDSQHNTSSAVAISGANDTRVTGDEVKNACVAGVNTQSGAETRVDHSFIHDNSYVTGCAVPTGRSNGIFSSTPNSNFNNNVLRDNGKGNYDGTNKGNGYGIYVLGVTGNKTLYNTLYDNGRDGLADSGAVSYINTTNGVIVNNIASNSINQYSDPAQCSGSSSYTMTDNIWYHYQVGLFTNCPAYGADNDEANDPLFSGTSVDIFRLGTGSPAQDTGDDSYSGYTDYEGITRPQSTCGALCVKHEDKGAFEKH